MQEKINKIILIIIPILIILLLINIIFFKKVNEYDNTIYYMDTYIYIKVLENDSEKANKILKEIENIYETYDKLTDKYNEYENIKNLYYLNYNTDNNEYIEIDSKLYKLIEYGKNVFEESNGLIDISLGNVFDIWKSYRTSNYGIPTYEELKNVNTDSIDNIELKNGKIKNNHVNIDLSLITIGYTNEIVKEYLKENNIENYIINAGGNIIVGKNYNGEKYSIGLENPNDSEKVYKVIYGKEISIVTTSANNKYYTWNGKKYSHIINPNTLFPTNYMKSVTVTTNDSSKGEILATMLYLMDIDSGLEYVNSNSDVEAIWYSNDDEIILSNGISKYEKK